MVPGSSTGSRDLVAWTGVILKHRDFVELSNPGPYSQDSPGAAAACPVAPQPPHW